VGGDDSDRRQAGAEVLAGYYGPDDDGKRSAEPVRQPEDVGASSTPRHPRGSAHGGTKRIMRVNGWRGVTRTRRPPRTTERDPAAAGRQT
jgi:putative transposase